MEKLFLSIGIMLILCGICLLTASVVIVKNIVSILPEGRIRIKWYILAGLICIFIIGYLIYAVILWNKTVGFFDLAVPVVFFLGACFVILVNNLSYHTAQDVKRMEILEKESITDALLQIFNRRYFHTKLDEEVERSERYNHPLSLVIVDIDHFKKINDVHGHQVGDTVLMGVASTLKLNVRKIDIIARYGGDELTVILPETDKNGAYMVAEKIRKKIENLSFDIPDVEKLSITASFGVSSLDMISDDDGGNKSRELIKMADDALYQAKKEGRNSVILYSNKCVISGINAEKDA